MTPSLSSISRLSEPSSYINRKHDVLTVYEDVEKQESQSILNGGLDTGINFGKFIIDTSNNIGPPSS